MSGRTPAGGDRTDDGTSRRIETLPLPEPRPLERSDLYLVGRALLLCWKYRLMLWLLPFRWVRPHLTRPADAVVQVHRRAPHPDRIAWAVGAAARMTPRGSCLVRALTAHRLCAGYGYRTRIRFGTALQEDGVLLAHAWLESETGVLVGEHDLERYSPLPELAPGDP